MSARRWRKTGARVTETERRVPAHLRRYVVAQDYARYDEIAQAVWRFVLLHCHQNLRGRAAPAFFRGLELTGIGPDAIPRIETLDERLAHLGWGALPVDGFIPPRAFQAFQARRLLPIAADIRSYRHLAYTPAPDILHEAAGHCPMLADPTYARFAERIGDLGERAFTVPWDDALYEAIYDLSEAKESPRATDEDVARAEARLERVATQRHRTSEAGELARLYWWTIEYGLVGELDDFRIYGAGLLSSLGESHTCHDPQVQKHPLTSEVTRVGYDITEAQPRLFVVPELGALFDVLDAVTATHGWSVGGQVALERARQSEQVASIELDSGATVVGVLDAYGWTGDRVSWLRCRGPSAIAWRGGILPQATPDHLDDGCLVPLGAVEVTGGLPIEALGPGERVTLSFAGGGRVTGRCTSVQWDDGRPVVLAVRDGCLVLPDDAGFVRGRELIVPLAVGVTSARAGAIDPTFFAPTEAPDRRVPTGPTSAQRDLPLLALYREALGALGRDSGPEVVRAFTAIHDTLERAFPDEWLLRWNLLESLLDRDAGEDLCVELERELDRLEVRHEHREPIASGLRYLHTAYPAAREDAR